LASFFIGVNCDFFFWNRRRPKPKRKNYIVTRRRVKTPDTSLYCSKI
jgi:hypothetical protein